MSGLDLKHHGRTVSASDCAKKGYKVLCSETHMSIWWSRTETDGRHRAGGKLHPSITIQTKRWWTVWLVGVVKRSRITFVQLGPITVEFAPLYDSAKVAKT